MSEAIAIYIESQWEIAEIPRAKSPFPGIKASTPRLLTPLNVSGTLGPGTLENTTVALLINQIKIS